MRKIKASQLKRQAKILVGNTVLVPFPNPQTPAEQLAFTVATTLERSPERSSDTGHYQWLVRYENGYESRWVDASEIMQYVV